MLRRLLVLSALLTIFVLPFAGAAFAERALGAPATPAMVRTYPGPAPCNTTLQACISAAGAGDVISVSAGTFITNELLITRALVLQGAGPASTVLQALGAQRVISVGANIGGGVVISNLRVFSGSLTSGSGFGAGVASGPGSPLTLQNVDVLSNSNKVNSGGGIFAGDALTLTSVNVIGNSDPGGAGGGLRAVSSAQISGGRFERNSALNPGGALRVSGALTLTNVTVISNAVSGAGVDGGGIRADGGLFMLGGLVQNNTAPDNGGGIMASSAVISAAQIISNAGSNGGGIYASGALTVLDSVLDANRAISGSGGAIYANGDVQLSGHGSERLNDNQAGLDGGAVYAGGALTLDNLELSANTAGGSGGAAAATSITVTGATISGNVALAMGGALQVSASANISGSLFRANRVTDDSGSGGAVAVAGPLSVGSSTFLSNSTPSPNTDPIGSFTAGGAIAAQGNATITDSIFQGNRSASGGAVYVAGNADFAGGSSVGNAAVQGGLVFAQGAVTISLHSTTFNTVTADGGCIYAIGAVFADQATVADCQAGRRGGGIFSAGTATLGSSTFERNSAGIAGGAVLGHNVAISQAGFYSNTANVGGAVSAAKSVTISASTFVSNIAVALGGAIYAGANGAFGAGEVVIGDSLFQDNQVTANASAGGLGGAIWVTGTLSISRSQLLGNRASIGGGGAAVAGSFQVISGTFRGNVGGGTGGGIWLQPAALDGDLIADSLFDSNGAICCGEGGALFIGTAGSLFPGAIIATSVFSGNFSGGGGGAVASYASTQITSSVFISNQTTGGRAGQGGAVTLGNTYQVQYSTFQNNRSHSDGGALALVDPGARFASIAYDVFDGNAAHDPFDACTGRGGAIYAAGQLNVSSSSLNGNSADGGGGALACEDKCSVFLSTLADNAASCEDALTHSNIASGGAVRAVGDFKALFSRFLRNSTGAAGGGAVAALSATTHTIDIENSLFAGNSAANNFFGAHGAAINISGTATAKLYFNTVVSDTLNGTSAIAVQSGSASVFDNIITGHAAGIERTGGTVAEDFNLFFSDTLTTTGTVLSGGNSLGGDPLFVAPAADDYHLQPGSPAIDRGTDVQVSTDFDGQARPFGPGFDIGYDEAVLQSVYLPLILR